MRQAIAIWPDGRCVTSVPTGIQDLRSRFADAIADGQQPAGTRFFRLPRRLEITDRVLALRGAMYDRVCPKCRCGMRFHDNVGPCF